MMKNVNVYFWQTEHNLDHFALESLHPVPTLRHPERSEGSPDMALDLNMEIPHYVRDDVDCFRDDVGGFCDDVNSIRDDNTTCKVTL